MFCWFYQHINIFRNEYLVHILGNMVETFVICILSKFCESVVFHRNIHGQNGNNKLIHFKYQTFVELLLAD